MKSVLIASAIALATVFSAASAMATDNGLREADKIFGPAVEMPMNGHTMHVRAVTMGDTDWVIMPREEFETMIGKPLAIPRFKMNGN